MTKKGAEEFLQQMRDVGVADLNHDHRRLVTTMADLHNLVAEISRRRPTQGEVDQLAGLFDQLEDYARYHFDKEDALMRQHRLPGSERHRQEHREFLKMISAFRKEFENGQVAVSINVKYYLLEWFVRHINHRDQRTFQSLVGPPA